MKLTYKFFTLLLLLFAFSCGTNKRTVHKKKDQTERAPRVVIQEKASAEVPEAATEVKKEVPKTVYKDKVAEYVAVYAALAKEEMQLYKIPASITLAQGILESGAGMGELSLKANNHFGIKCHGWKGGSVFHDDDRPQECFRKYNDPKYSYRDHSLFLTERKRYAGLFDLSIDDYKGWAKGLRAAGYATDVKYPEKLISLIERYELYKYDAEVLGKEIRVARVDTNRDSQQYVVQQGDTLYSIARRYNLSVEQLKEYNKLEGSDISIGQVLYVSP